MSARSVRLAVRFTTEELAAVRVRARAARAPVARYIRDASLGHTPRARDTAAYADAVRALNRIGLDLRAIVADRPGAEENAALAIGELRHVLHALADVLRPARRKRADVNVAALE